VALDGWRVWKSPLFKDEPKVITSLFADDGEKLLLQSELGCAACAQCACVTKPKGEIIPPSS
jgi:hypothetical protein